jgi:hypothetical protein
VDDPEFWEGVSPLEFGSLPRLQDQVAVVGYPVGGESISITVGVVSRIEVRMSRAARAARASQGLRTPAADGG